MQIESQPCEPALGGRDHGAVGLAGPNRFAALEQRSQHRNGRVDQQRLLLSDRLAPTNDERDRGLLRALNPDAAHRGVTK